MNMAKFGWAAALAAAVDGLGGHFLAGAAFPLDEHGGACGRHLLDGFEHGLERVGFADDALDGEFLPDLLLERGVTVSEIEVYPRQIKFAHFRDPDGNKIEACAHHHE